MYFLVVLRAGERAADEPLHAADHERFIDSLIRRNLVLLGGGFAEPIGDAVGAYLLRCETVDEARGLVESDPYVANGVVKPELTRWELLGINPDAVDASLVLRPEDV